MSDLTARQREILRFIEHRVLDSGFPPTREEVASAFGFASVTAAKNHLLALARKGYIELAPHSARGIRLLHEPDAALVHQYELPLIGRIAAGAPLTAAENAEGWLRVDPSLFRPRADFLHRIAGHSMKDAHILDGDLVGIRAQSTADSGQIIAAVLPQRATGDDEITLKRYFRRGSIVRLQPENPDPAYHTLEIDLALPTDSQEFGRFRIAGVFVGLIRPAG